MSLPLRAIATLTLTLLTCPALAGSIDAAAEAAPEAEAPFSAALSAGYESRYVTEGRDNLPGDGLAWSQLDFGTSAGFFAGAWFGTGTGEKYRELQLFAGWGVEFGDFAAEVAYTWLQFADSNGAPDDHEFALGLEWTGIQWITPAAGSVYGAGSGGSYLEVALRGNIPAGSRLTFHPVALVGWDFGYAGPDDEGVSNFQFGLEAEFALTEHATLNAHISHSIALEDTEADGGEDLTWAGCSLTVSY